MVQLGLILSKGISVLSSLKRFLRSARTGLEIAWSSRGNTRRCGLCGWTGHRFLTHGAPQKRRLDARCPKCGSLERHRLAFQSLKGAVEPWLPDRPWRVLHVAPETCIEPWLRRESSEYLSIDKYGPAMKQMDLVAMDLPDQSFDFVWCSHVLEHIEADQDAMREIFRVLAPGGVLLAQVPVWRTETYEDARLRSDEERLRAFYQRDHVRLYGLDIVSRFEKAGFEVRVVHARDFGPSVVAMGSLSYLSTNEVFLCKRSL